jgi:hypothetical protein
MSVDPLASATSIMDVMGRLVFQNVRFYLSVTDWLVETLSACRGGILGISPHSFVDQDGHFQGDQFSATLSWRLVHIGRQAAGSPVGPRRPDSLNCSALVGTCHKSPLVEWMISDTKNKVADTFRAGEDITEKVGIYVYGTFQASLALRAHILASRLGCPVHGGRSTTTGRKSTCTWAGRSRHRLQPTDSYSIP